MKNRTSCYLNAVTLYMGICKRYIYSLNFIINIYIDFMLIKKLECQLSTRLSFRERKSVKKLLYGFALFGLKILE